MSIYLEMYEKVTNGESFHIDFEKRTMKVGGQIIIDNGEYDASKALYEGKCDNLNDILDEIREYYADYKYSLPSERNDNKRKKYFKALPVDELTDEQMMFGKPREVAQYALEALILCMIVRGDFVWDEKVLGNWFWQDEFDQDLVILRRWVEIK
jgi:hypothetical protein